MGETEDNELIEDGFGSIWETCGPGCSLQIVRPGRVQCNTDVETCPDRSGNQDRNGSDG